jgi:hypothetical protein
MMSARVRLTKRHEIMTRLVLRCHVDYTAVSVSPTGRFANKANKASMPWSVQDPNVPRLCFFCVESLVIQA